MSEGSDMNSLNSSSGSSNLNSLDCWDYTLELDLLRENPDLHLAAELGKTLLDRNRELEAILKEKQTTIEDQKLEIEYLTKQTVALKEVNESRLRIYEQLEVNIQDLERTNHRLQFENNTEKKHVKSLNETVEKLEAKNEELDSTVRDLRRRLQHVSERKSPQSSDGGRSSNTISHKEFRSVSPISSKYDKVASPCQEGTNFLQLDHVRRISSTPNPCKSKPVATSNQPECDQASIEEPDRNMEEMTELMAQLRESRVQCSRYERKLTELEENLASIVQQNSVLESQVITLTHKEEDLNMKSMHEELTTLAEVRQGQLCSKCLGSMEMEQPSEVELPEDDDLSMLNSLNTSQHRSSFTMSVQGQDKRRWWTLKPPLLSAILSFLLDLCVFVRDEYVLPHYRPFKCPFVLLCYRWRQKPVKN